MRCRGGIRDSGSPGGAQAVQVPIAVLDNPTPFRIDRPMSDDQSRLTLHANTIVYNAKCMFKTLTKITAVRYCLCSFAFALPTLQPV